MIFLSGWYNEKMAEVAIPFKPVDNNHQSNKSLKEKLGEIGASAKKMMKDVRNAFTAKDINRQQIDDSTDTATGDQDIQLSPAETKDIDQNSENLHPLEIEAAELQVALENSTIPTNEEFPDFIQTWLQEIAKKYQEEYQKMYSYLNPSQTNKQDEYSFQTKINYQTTIRNWQISNDEIGKLPSMSNSLIFNMYATYPKEHAMLQLFQARRIYELFQRKKHHQTRFAFERLKNAVNNAKGTLNREAEDTQLSHEIESGEHILTHGVATEEGIKLVFKTGSLLSRQAQLNIGMSAIIATSGSDFNTRIIEHPDGSYDKEITNRYGRNLTRHTKDEPFSKQNRERFDIDFAEDSLYYFPNQSGLGITFVFSAADILSDISFYSSDGTHAHANNFYPEQEKPKGYEVQLTQRKHILVAHKDAEKFVTELIEGATWITDKQAYLDSVVFISRKDYALTDEDLENKNLSQEQLMKIKAGKKVHDIAKERFATQPGNKTKHILPTDVILPGDTNYVRTNQILYQYR